MDTAKRIECAFNPVCKCSHESGYPMRIECTLSPIHLRRWIGNGLKLDYIIYDLREVTPTMRSFGLLVGLAFLGLWRVLYR